MGWDLSGQVEAVTRELGLAPGAPTVAFLIADLSGRALVRLAHVPLDGTGEGRRHGDDVATVIPFDGGLAEQALRAQTVQVVAQPDRWTVLAPVTDRGEAIGLLEMILPDEPGPGVLREIARTAHVLAFVVIANRRYTDLFEWGQRTTPFTLSGEIQRRLLPGSFTCEGSAFTLSGWLEPAASIGGDTFDYSVARDVLHFSVTDAMGHGVASALTATLGVGSLRNSRRRAAGCCRRTSRRRAAYAEATPLTVSGQRPRVVLITTGASRLHVTQHSGAVTHGPRRNCAMRVTLTMSLPRQPSSVTRARQVLTTLLSLTDCAEDSRGHLAVLITEACANAVMHATVDSSVDIAILIEDDVCLIEVGNRGSTPNGAGLTADLPDPLTVGGRGLPLIAALADTAAFVPGPPDEVLLRITKHLSDVRPAPVR
ncbi:serine/threonine protein phosphatase [Micromonospora acroterricola]|uniref:Serine/threonine protein phosphatase n=1 Tax=Micromonospora acroterricola TaxID=2202421 RepID=A0A317CZ38_9ACTN|nr:ATP-binding protein [Micromonospora acroterricola]PWR05555.1 serine/threonine protein phosphatase [Micromonospora acroterricola]